jgi:hypothetical protein
MNQPMRNVALAAATVQTKAAARVTFALCAPNQHGLIWRRWREAPFLFASHATVRLADLPAELVAAQRADRTSALQLCDHYMLDPRLAVRRHDRLEWQDQLDQWFPLGAALEVSDDGEPPWFPHVDPRPLALAARSDSSVMQVLGADDWHPFQPHIARITSDSMNIDTDGHGTLLLRAAPNSRRVVNARVAGANVERLQAPRDRHDPSTIDDEQADQWLDDHD